MKEFEYNGMIIALEEMGLVHLKTVGDKIYFERKVDAKINELELQRVAKAYKHYGYTIMLKKAK